MKIILIIYRLSPNLLKIFSFQHVISVKIISMIDHFMISGLCPYWFWSAWARAQFWPGCACSWSEVQTKRLTFVLRSPFAMPMEGVMLKLIPPVIGKSQVPSAEQCLLYRTPGREELLFISNEIKISREGRHPGKNLLPEICWDLSGLFFHASCSCLYFWKHVSFSQHCVLFWCTRLDI